MLTLLPQILWLAPFSALVLRIALAVVLGVSAWRHLSFPRLSARLLSAVEIILAAGLLLGIWTQAVAIVVALLCLASLLVRTLRAFPRSTVLLACVIALSIIVTGAGAFAFDLPL